MPFVLTLDPRAGLGTRETRTLRAGTLSIGRGPGNDWVLADPDRHLSKTHCVIGLEGGRCILTDLSTNGVFVNGAREATRRDSRIELTDGDDFRIGDYRITVAELAQEVPSPPGAPAQDFDPLAGDLLDDPFGEAPAAPAGAFHHPIPQAAMALRAPDPFDALDGNQGRTPLDDDDLFGAPPAGDAWSGPAQPDNVDAAFHAIPAPRPVTPASLDDLDFDALLGDEPIGATSGPFAPATQASPAPPPIAAAPPPPAAIAPQAAPGTAPGHEASLRAFLEGAGVPDLRTGPEAEATLAAAGAVFRAMVEGLREVLMSRSAIKNELRVEQTMLRARGNNALKFSVTPEEAVAALLLPERTGYKPALDSAREAFADLRSHEMAVMAGMQTALIGLLRRFDPAALEQRLSPGRLDSILPAARKARNWEQFCATYKDIAREAEDDFQSVFGREFARAYEAQMKKL